MHTTSLYKATGLADVRHQSRRDALAWLARQLRWEQKLTRLRSPTRVTDRQAA
ncbi:MAG: hypothetical protein ACT4OX_16735 [Actinomycetota bacterium]